MAKDNLLELIEDEEELEYLNSVKPLKSRQFSSKNKKKRNIKKVKLLDFEF